MRKGAMVLTMLAMAGGAQAQRPNEQELFCNDLNRIIEDAQAPYPFHLLENGRAAPPTLGFVHGCGRSGDARQYFWLCTMSLAHESMNLANLVARTRACLPDVAPRETDYREVEFPVPHALIRISESGGPRAHVGLSATFVVEADPAAPAGK